MIELIKSAKEELEQAKQIECVCDGFSIQYNQGCTCERGKQTREAKRKLERYLDQLVDVEE